MFRWVSAVIFFGIALSLPALEAEAEEQRPPALKSVSIEEHLGNVLDLDLSFTDHQGREVVLRDFFKGGKPVLLTLNYYRCAMLCNLQLNALVESLGGMEWVPGDQFRILTLSIDPNEGPDLARGKRTSYLNSLGRGEVDWTFLVGGEENIKKVADTVGFSYVYDPKTNEFAHPAAAFFLSPTGTVSRYLYGIQYKSRDIKFALVEASEGRLGSPVDKLILSCFHYDSSRGAYGPFAFGIMRLGGVVTMVVLGGALVVMWRRERRNRG